MNRYLIAILTAALFAGIVLAWLIIAAGFMAVGAVLEAMLHFILVLIPGGRP